MRINVLMMILALAVMCAAPALAQVRPNVIVSNFSVVGGSADVGKGFTLAVVLKNIELAACANTITTTIQASPPFIMNGLSTIPAGDLCGGKSTVVSFPMKIDPTAVGGTYQLTVASSYETITLAQFSSSSTINLFVNGTPEINAYLVDSSPGEVYPGDTAQLTFNIQNDGSFQAQGVKATLSAASPIEVEWAKSFSSLGTLDPKTIKTARFTVDVPKNAASGDYRMNLELQYLDENLALNARSIPFSLHAKSKALFETADSGSDALYSNENSRTLRLNIKNTGTDTARRVKLRLMPQFPFSTDGSVQYVDEIRAGESIPVQISIDIDKDARAGSYGLDLLADFEDAQGNKLQDTATVSVTVRPKTIFRSLFVEYWFLWAAAIVAVLLVARKVMSKRK